MRICLRSFVTGFWNSSPSCSSSVSRHATSPEICHLIFPSHTSHLCSSLSGKEPQSQPSVPVWLTSQLACVEPTRLQAWLRRMTASPPKDSDQLDTVQENRQLLQLLTSYIVRDNSQWARASALCFWALSYPWQRRCWPAGMGAGFPELMVIMATLASAGQGAGHLQLHRAAIDWLTRW